MAFSMFERPKLQNAKSLKFYPEDYNHHVSYRHKHLPVHDFHLGDVGQLAHKHLGRDPDKLSIRPQLSQEQKCPIYVHSFVRKFSKNDPYEGDPVKKRKNKSRMLDKLEESYWANWKPDNSQMQMGKKPATASSVRRPKTAAKSAEVEVIKSAPPMRRKKIKVFPPPGDREITHPDVPTLVEVEMRSKKTQEIQTDLLVNEAKTPQESTEDILADTKFLRHTDSLIITSRRQKAADQEHFEQPKCIRLYKKPGKCSKNFIRGGSYPLKSCLKKESNFSNSTKGNIRLGRPGSPIIVSSSLANRSNKLRHPKR